MDAKEEQVEKKIMDDEEEEHSRMLRKCVENMTRIKPPNQSNFRVYAIIVLSNAKGERVELSGTNSECPEIGQSLCAERSAAVRLREVGEGYDVKTVYLISDMLDEPITPGLLCREYLVEACPRLDVRILIATRDLKKRRWTVLRDLWPCPSLYRRLNAREIDSKTVLTRETTKMTIPKSYRKLHKFLSNLVAKKRDDDALHPVRYVAGIELENGITLVEFARKGLEYGTSMDGVSAMLPAILSSSSKPVRGIRLDHYGVLHAPCAVARARLFEQPKCDALQFLIHVQKDDVVELKEMTIDSLAPDFPKWRGGCGCT
jgi:cytidine deaminase